MQWQPFRLGSLVLWTDYRSSEILYLWIFGIWFGEGEIARNMVKHELQVTSYELKT